MNPNSQTTPPTQEEERDSVLEQLEDWLEKPLIVLGFVWLALFIVELTRGLGPVLTAAGFVIQGLFVAEFALRLALAPRKHEFLKRNWLAALSLLAPAFRVLRVARVARVLRATRAVRGIRLVRVVGSINRGMRVLGATLGRRGFAYVIALTIVVTFVGAAGMYAFEQDTPEKQGLHDYGTALWWTAMIMTTMGSEYWPRTGEGRVLCLLLAMYSFAMFGYVTATIASFFIGRDADNQQAEVAGQKSIEALRQEIAAMREELRDHASGAP